MMERVFDWFKRQLTRVQAQQTTKLEAIGIFLLCLVFMPVFGAYWLYYTVLYYGAVLRGKRLDAKLVAIEKKRREREW